MPDVGLSHSLFTLLALISSVITVLVKLVIDELFICQLHWAVFEPTRKSQLLVIHVGNSNVSILIDQVVKLAKSVWAIPALPVESGLLGLIFHFFNNFLAGAY
jgi:hypothetical protein